MSDHADTIRGTLTPRIDEIRAEYWDARERLGEAVCLDQIALALARVEAERDALAARRDALENALREAQGVLDAFYVIALNGVVCTPPETGDEDEGTYHPFDVDAMKCGECRAAWRRLLSARAALAATDTTREALLVALENEMHGIAPPAAERQEE
jgi:hypothetical protein